MNIRIHEQLYSEDISDRKLAVLKKKLIKKSVKLDLFLVTLPLGKEGILEIYWYPELLQKAYQDLKCELRVIGVAKNRDEAFELIRTIVEDVGIAKGTISMKEFIEENSWC